MKYAVAAVAATLAIAGLAGCDRPTTSGSAGTTTVVKEPVVKEKDTVVHDTAAPSAAPSTSTSVNVDATKQPEPSTSSSTSVNVDATKPSTTETSKSTTRVDTPAGTATKTETTRTTQ